MGYSEAKRAEYPDQDEQQLLIEFAAQALARRQYLESRDPDTTWTDWLGDPDDPEGRLAPYREHAASLSEFGMLTWPARTEKPLARWWVERAGQYRGMNAAPELDWIDTYGMDCAAALERFRASRNLGIPCRLAWTFFRAGC